MQRFFIPIILGAATLVSACAGTYSARATVSTPDLVYAGPGVRAVVNFGDPVFYADNYYWRYDDGYWYRSPYLTGGWTFVPRPPVVISRIDRPYARYYRDRGRVHIDYRYRPSDRTRPIEIREHRRRTVDRGDSPRVRVIERSR
jgi:hypothetical protein